MPINNDLNREATAADVENYTAMTNEALKLGLTLQQISDIASALGKTSKELLDDAESYNLKEAARAKMSTMSLKDRREYLKTQRESLKGAKEQLKEQIKIRQANGEDVTVQKEQLKLINDRLSITKQTSDALKDTLLRYKEINKESGGKGVAAAVVGDAVNTVTQALGAIGTLADASFTEAENILTQYNSRLTARLQGTNKNFNDMATLVNKNLAGNPFVKQTDVLNKIANAVDSGIAYNVELRSYLDVLSDDIISTFDAFDSNMTRIIRAQQSDSTIARLGMESKLDQLFNTYFSDTSYLSDALDGVRTAILDLEITQSRSDATETEYILQKWLGSLYSVGVSSGTVSNIAGAINMLGTGNVNGLSGSAMQNLLAMSASRGGGDYADLLTHGLDASNLNDLMYSMVSYLSEIAETTKDNNVVATAYGEAFGVGIADLHAIANLGDTINDIYDEMLSYDDAMAETSRQIGLIVTRQTLPEMLSNVIDNLKYSAASGIINSSWAYPMYKITDFVGDVTGGIDLPTITVLGTGIDLPELTGMIKAGFMGISSIMSIFNSIGNLSTALLGEGLDLSKWNYQDTMTRGEGFSLSTTTGSSFSGLIGNSSGNDMMDSLITEANESAKNTERTRTGKNVDEAKDFDDLYEGLFDADSDGGLLTSMAINMNNIDTHLVTMHEELTKVTTDNTINVNLQAINGSQLKDSLPLHFSDTGSLQMERFVAKLGASLGLAEAQGNSDTEIHTLQDLINFFMDEVGDSTSDTMLNVNLKSNEVEAMSFLTNSGRSYGGTIG